MGILTIVVWMIGISMLSISITFWSWFLSVIGLWKIFGKAGERPWKALIPFYSEYIETKIAWNANVYFKILAFSFGMAVSSYFMDKSSGILQTIWIICYGVCIAAGLILNIKKCSRLAKCFGKGSLFTLGLILLPSIFRLMLAFDDSKYNKPLY